MYNRECSVISFPHSYSYINEPMNHDLFVSSRLRIMYCIFDLSLMWGVRLVWVVQAFRTMSLPCRRRMYLIELRHLRSRSYCCAGKRSRSLTISLTVLRIRGRD